MSKRWSYRKAEWVERPDVDDFIRDVEAVCRKYGLSIGHEDAHGAFIVGGFHEADIEWLRHAHLSDQ